MANPKEIKRILDLEMKMKNAKKEKEPEFAVDILQIEDFDEIKQKYRKASVLYHPDKFQHPMATKLTQLITWAKRILDEDEEKTKMAISYLNTRRRRDKEERAKKYNKAKKYNIFDIGKNKKNQRGKKSEPKKTAKKTKPNPTKLPKSSYLKPEILRPTEVLTAKQINEKKAAKIFRLQSKNGIRRDIADRRFKSQFE